MDEFRINKGCADNLRENAIQLSHFVSGEQTEKEQNEYREQQLKESCQALAPHVSHFACDIKSILGESRVQETIHGADYSDYSMKRTSSTGCTFCDSKFHTVAATGSRWKDVVFQNCSFDYSNFQFCNFSGSKFYSVLPRHDKNDELLSTRISGCAFFGAYFSKTIFADIDIKGSSFVQCNFTGATISNSLINTSTFEGAIFESAFLKNIAFRTINLDYSDFTGASFENVRIPLMQLCYVFGGVSAALDERGLCVDTEDSERFPDGRLSKDELQRLLPSLKRYYKHKAEFFPLANIYIANGEIDKFQSTIGFGIRLAITNRDMRELKYLCKLVYLSEVFSSKKLRYLSDLIIALVEESSDKRMRFDYMIHKGEIQSFLNSCGSQPCGIVRFKVVPKIKDCDLKALNTMLLILTDALEILQYDVRWSLIEAVKHSPINAAIEFVSSSPEQLSDTLVACQIILAGTRDFLIGAGAAAGGIAALMKSFKSIQKIPQTKTGNNDYGKNSPDDLDEKYQFDAIAKRRMSLCEIADIKDYRFVISHTETSQLFIKTSTSIGIYERHISRSSKMTL